LLKQVVFFMRKPMRSLPVQPCDEQGWQGSEHNITAVANEVAAK
jgi:hypothetical protein